MAFLGIRILFSQYAEEKIPENSRFAQFFQKRWSQIMSKCISPILEAPSIEEYQNRIFLISVTIYKEIVYNYKTMFFYSYYNGRVNRYVEFIRMNQKIFDSILKKDLERVYPQKKMHALFAEKFNDDVADNVAIFFAVLKAQVKYFDHLEAYGFWKQELDLKSTMDYIMADFFFLVLLEIIEKKPLASIQAAVSERFCASVYEYHKYFAPIIKKSSLLSSQYQCLK